MTAPGYNGRAGGVVAARPPVALPEVLALRPGSIVALRPLTFADTLDSIVLVLRWSLAPVAVVVFAVVWPDLLIREAIMARLAPVPTSSLDPDALLQAYVAGAPIWVANILVALFVSAVVSGALVALLGARDRGSDVGAGAALLFGVRRSGAVLGASLLGLGSVAVVALVTVVFATLFGVLIPIVGFLVMLPVLLAVLLLGFAISYLVVPVAIEEGRGPWSSFLRTLVLLRRGAWRVLATTALVLLLLLTIAGGLLFLGAVLMDLLGTAGWILEALGGALLAAIATPLLAATGFVVHRDLRVRTEGYDLIVRIDELTGAAR